MRKMDLFNRPRREGLPYRLSGGPRRELFQPLAAAEWIAQEAWEKGGETV